MSFLSRSELFSYALSANPRLTIDNVPQEVVDQANMMVLARLREGFITSDVSGEAGAELLTSAAICFGMELLNYNGVVRWSTGEIVGTEEGPFKMFFQNRWLPMRWEFPDRAAFDQMMPHETWRMMGHRFVNSFITCRAVNAGGHTVEMLHDNTMRGHGATDRFRW